MRPARPWQATVAGSGSRGSLADLKIVPGRAVMLAADAVSAETVA